jgi:hypothetical protein
MSAENILNHFRPKGVGWLKPLSGLCHSSLMRPGTQAWLNRVGPALVLLFLAALLFPAVARIAGVGLGFFLLALVVLGYLIFAVGMPFFAWIMGEAGYKVFLKPYVRAWRINRIRNARYLREALERSKEDSN